MAEIIVTSTADSGAGTLRAAIGAARNGDVILFDADVFPAGQTTSILLSSSFNLNYNITIDADEPVEYLGVVREVDGVDTIVEITPETPAQEGEHPARFLRCRVALDGQDGRRIATVGQNREPTLRGLEMTRGLNSGAILNIYQGTTTTLINCSVIRGVSSQTSAPIVCGTGSQIFKNCVFVLNQGRGVFWNQGDSIQTFEGCRFIANHTDANGGALQFAQQAAGEAVINNCDFIDNSANKYGGAIYTANTKKVALNNCNIISCTAPNGGGVYSTNTSQNTLTDCVISGCSAANGGGVYSANMSQNTLNACQIVNCSATSNGGGVYSLSSGATILDNCELYNNIGTDATRKGATFAAGSAGVIINTTLDAIRVIGSATVTIGNGVTRVIASAFISSSTTSPVITIADGAALTITDSATIGAATFTSDGRGYLAVAPGIDASAATLTNVVLCSYGADASQFHEDLGVLYWDAADPTTPVLLEYEVEVEGAAQWVTLIRQTTGESYTRYFGPGVNLRLFDGEKFLTTSTPSSRTYYYIGGAEGSFTAAADWSLTRGGYAIPEPPTVKDCVFVVGDVAEPTTEEETTEETP